MMAAQRREKQNEKESEEGEDENSEENIAKQRWAVENRPSAREEEEP